MLINGQSTLGGISATQPTGSTLPTTQPASAIPERLSGPPLPVTTLNRSNDSISHYHDWYVLGETQSHLSDAQASEFATLQLFRQLGAFTSALGQTSTDRLASQLKQWESQLQSQTSLDNQLQPGVLQKSGIQQFFTLEKVDLLVSRPKDEQVGFFFRDTRTTVSLTLPANASKAELLLRLQTALGREGIQVRLNNAGQLELGINSADRQKLDRPVLLSGEGYRIPAGNPLAIKLQPVEGLLTQLANQLLGLNAAQLSAFSQEIEVVRKRLKFNISRLRKYRKQLLDELEAHAFDFDAADNEPDLQFSQQLIRELLQSDHYRTTSTNLAAQTNLSRKNVIALLFD
jgi:hypothetical protein